VSSALAYAGPLFLNRILAAIAAGGPAARARAHVDAVLALAAALAKAGVDAQSLWLGRCAFTRVRSELMAAMCAKALVRRAVVGTPRAGVGRDADGDGMGRRPRVRKARTSARS
jgi:hypothetical protein